MQVQVEKLEKNMAKLTIEIPADVFEAALTASYKKNKNRFNVPGFRKGKAPQYLIEKMYGPGILYEDAVQKAVDDSYPDARRESGLEIVSSAELDVVQVEKGRSLIYTATVAVKPEVTLGEYRGIEVERARPEVTDEDVERKLKEAQKENARLITVDDRPVQDGDQTIIDFTGYIDGRPFENGDGKDYSLKIGSHSFIDTFEQQLIGAAVGEEREINVTFPEDYHASDLAGRPALFKVLVKEIQTEELPELDDEFAGEVSEFDTLEEYKADIRQKLEQEKQAKATTENENNVINKVIENASMEIPEPMINEEARGLVNDFARRIQSQGVDFDQYLQFTQMTVDQLIAQMRPQAETRIKNTLVLEAVSKAENITVDDEAVDAEIRKMAENYKMEEDRVRSLLGENGLKNVREDLVRQETIDFLVAEAKLV